jgi:hypothetical protein
MRALVVGGSGGPGAAFFSLVPTDSRFNHVTTWSRRTVFAALPRASAASATIAWADGTATERRRRTKPDHQDIQHRACRQAPACDLRRLASGHGRHGFLQALPNRRPRRPIAHPAKADAHPMDVISRLAPQDSGQVFDWQGKIAPEQQNRRTQRRVIERLPGSLASRRCFRPDRP